MPGRMIRTKRGVFYARAGGAWEKRKNGRFVYVGAGKGSYSKRSTSADRKRRAKKNSRLRRKYPQSYD